MDQCVRVEVWVYEEKYVDRTGRTPGGARVGQPELTNPLRYFFFFFFFFINLKTSQKVINH